jgi:hypothetical protein
MGIWEKLFGRNTNNKSDKPVNTPTQNTTSKPHESEVAVDANGNLRPQSVTHIMFIFFKESFKSDSEDTLQKLARALYGMVNPKVWPAIERAHGSNLPFVCVRGDMQLHEKLKPILPIPDFVRSKIHLPQEASMVLQNQTLTLPGNDPLNFIVATIVNGDRRVVITQQDIAPL